MRLFQEILLFVEFSISSLGTSICHEFGPKKKRKQNKTKNTLNKKTYQQEKLNKCSDFHQIVMNPVIQNVVTNNKILPSMRLKKERMYHVIQGTCFTTIGVI